MYINESRKRSYSRQTLFNVLSAAAGLSVIAVAAVSFVDPDRYAWLFPVEFLLAAVFQCLLAAPRFSDHYGRGSGGRKAFGVCLFVVAGLLLALAIVSAVCLWR